MSPPVRRFAVIGKPVGHSQSPAIHAAFFRRHQIGACYERFEMEPGTLGPMLRQRLDEGYVGFNVTYPLKQAILPLLASLDDDARELGAVNTLVLTGESTPDRLPMRGFNTDGAGFCEYVERELDLPLAGKRVLFLGAGNTVRSILLELARRGARVIRVVNRSRERLEEPAMTRLAARFERFEGMALDEVARWEEVFEVDLIVQATSLGLSGATGDFPWPLRELPAEVPVIDLNYLKGGPTPFLAEIPHVRLARDGKGMLLYQAAKAFEHWWGFFPDVAGLLGELFPDGLK